MTLQPALPQSRAISPELRAWAKPYLDARRSDNTKRTYRSVIKAFEKFCYGRGESPCPASGETVLEYIRSLTTGAYKKKVSTISIHLSAISSMHKAVGYDDPTKRPEVQAIMEGVRRKLGVAPEQKRPLLAAHLKKIVACLPRNVTGKRNRAMLLIAYAGGFRRDELLALTVNDLRWSKNKLEIKVRKSKTDQTGKGMTKHIPRLKGNRLCPYTALKVWLSVSGITSGYVFRKVDRWQKVGSGRMNGKSFATIVKASLKDAGIDPKDYSGHSARSGIVSDLFRRGESITTIQKITGHKSLEMVAYYNRGGGEQSSRAVGKALRG